MAKAGQEKAPNTTLAIVAIVLIALGLGWTLYQANPGGMLRAKTEDEIKEEKEAIKEEEHKKREAERSARRAGKPVPAH